METTTTLTDNELTNNNTNELTNEPTTLQIENGVKKIDPRSDEYTEEHYKSVKNPMESFEGQFFSVDRVPEEQRRNLVNLTFDEWNRIQKPHERILHPAGFDMEPPKKIDFGQLDVGKKYEKPDGSTGEYNSMNIFPQGKAKGSITIWGPTVIASRGYTKLKDTADECVPFIMDMNNPHHRHFIYYTYPEFMRMVMEKMMEAPSDFGIVGGRKITGITQQMRETDALYKAEIEKIYSQIKHFWRYPQVDKADDFTSQYRMCFLNPIWKEENKVTGAKAFKTTIKVVSRQRNPENLSLQGLKRISQGYRWDPETNQAVKGNPQAIELSFSITFSRITKTATPAVKPTATNLIIYDIFDSRKMEREADIKCKEMASFIDDDVSFDNALKIEKFASTIIDPDEQRHKLRPNNDEEQKNDKQNRKDKDGRENRENRDGRDGRENRESRDNESRSSRNSSRYPSPNVRRSNKLDDASVFTEGKREAVNISKNRRNTEDEDYGSDNESVYSKQGKRRNGRSGSNTRRVDNIIEEDDESQYTDQNDDESIQKNNSKKHGKQRPSRNYDDNNSS